MNGVTGERAKRGIALLAGCCLIALAVGCGSEDSGQTETAGTAASAGTTVGEFVTLATKKCRTSKGLDRPDVPLEAETTVPVSSQGLEGFAAFTNTTGTVLIGPRDWKCDSMVAADGGERIGLTPDGTDPFEEGAELGVTYQASVGCQGCIADEICTVLPDAPVVIDYANLGTGCNRSKPLKEKLTMIGDLSVLFEDPPGVRGQGDPSGGKVRSIGMLTYSEDRGVQKVSCAVPDDLADACPSIVSGSLLHSLAYLIQG